MITAEEKLFPNGIPAFLSISDFSKLIGISNTQGAKIAHTRPEMLVTLPSMEHCRIKSELYFELKQK